MDFESKLFLQNLHMACGVSGFEEHPQKVWLDRTKEYADGQYTDVMGNSVAYLGERFNLGKTRIMLDSHIDEIGFIINYISDEGFLHMEAIGGPDEVVLAGSRLRVHTKEGYIDGVLGKKATHLEKESESEKVVGLDELWLDIGAKDKEDAEKAVSLGDWVTFVPNFMEMRNGLFTTKSADNRVGSFVISEVLKIVSESKLNLTSSVFASSSVQEEVGLRGSTVSAYQIRPTVGFAVDLTFSGDTPFAEKKEVGDIKLGGGPVIHPGPMTNRKLYNIIVLAAKEAGIKYQVQPTGYPGGTDTDVIQTNRNGTATALISVPSRYMHTAVEVCSYEDVELTAKLIAESVFRIDSNSDFIPMV